MTAFALIHGSGDGGWAWHLVQEALRARGHVAVASDLPTDPEDATWDDCVEVVASALAEEWLVGDVVVVGHSSGGLLVPLVAERLGAALQVFVAGMVPRAGESASAWFPAVGWYEAVAAPADAADVFHHDVPAALAREAVARERVTGERLGEVPWPSPALPPIPARYVVTARDRFIPPAVQRRVAAERLGIGAPDELDAGHCAPLSRPGELAALLAHSAEQAPVRAARRPPRVGEAR